MWRQLLVVVAAGLLVAADEPKKEPPDLKDKLQGTWMAVAAERGGEKRDPPPGAQFAFEGDKFTLHIGGEGDIKGTFTVDAAKKPAHIDLKIAEGGPERFKDKVAKGLVELDGDTLKWCSNEPGADDRPTELKTTENARTMLITLKREKK
jgi:uncharacterized protein (TIGR03067 family)